MAITIKEGMSDAEYEAAVKTLFTDADADKNGCLTLDEWAGFIRSCATAAGESTEDAEDQVFLKEFFTMFDANGDGKVQWDEAWNALKDQKPDGL